MTCTSLAWTMPSETGSAWSNGQTASARAPRPGPCSSTLPMARATKTGTSPLAGPRPNGATAWPVGQERSRMDERAEKARDFAAGAGWGDAGFVLLAGDASARRYYRLRRGDATAVIMDAPPALAGSTGRFARMSRWLLANG